MFVLLFISTCLKYLSLSCTIVLLNQWCLWWTSFTPWTLPSILWIFVRNRKWVSWLVLPHSRSGLSSDQILLWILILSPSPSPPPSFPFFSLLPSLLFFFWSSGTRLKFSKWEELPSPLLSLWKLIFAKDLIMFLNEFSLKLQDKMVLICKTVVVKSLWQLMLFELQVISSYLRNFHVPLDWKWFIYNVMIH